MTLHTAFLRAINVSGHTVTMDLLRASFEALGLEKVETFLASGNVIFESQTSAPELEKKIETKLKKDLGFEVPAFVRSADEIRAAAAHPAFPAAQVRAAGALNVGFMKEPLNELQLKKLGSLRTELDEFHAHQRELYWICRVKQSGSKVSNASLEKALGIQMTLRGMNTVSRLAEKIP